MSFSHPTATWEAMADGTTFYNRLQVYLMQWQGMHDLSDYIVCVGQHGGPLAMMRDTNKLAVLRTSSQVLGKTQVQIWSPAGEGLVLFSWETRIIRFGWTSSERLVLLNEEGVYRLYDLQGNYEQYALGGEASETGVVDARIWEDGMVVITGSLGYWELRGWGNRPAKLADSGLSEAPQTWSLIPPHSSPTAHTQILMSSTNSPSLYLLDSLECVDQRLSRGPFLHISPSANGKYIALLTFTGLLWVVSSDFSRSLVEWEAGSSEYLKDGIRQVKWCGNDAVVVSSMNGTSVLVGPAGDTLLFLSSSPVHLAPEPDGVRIISSSTHLLIEKVPAATLNVFKPGSTHPSAALFDAWALYSDREKKPGSATKVEQSIRRIRDNGDMASAVDGCILAAGGLWEGSWQKKALEAAKFGRAYLTTYNPSDLVNMGRALKVLNAVRFYEVGVPLTYAEYSLSHSDRIINRLTARNFHLLAFRISSFLGLKPDGVLKHWASSKIAAPTKTAPGEQPLTDVERDEELCKAIVEKFEKFGGKGISYSEVARKAWEVGRSSLATKLLDHEIRAADQVPLLLQMKEDKLALLKAVDSGDTDLIYTTLLTLQPRHNLGDFFALLDSSPRLYTARKLLELYARSQNREMLRDFYYADDRRVESAILALEEAASMTDPAARITSVKAAQKFFSEDRDRAFEAKEIFLSALPFVTDEHARLLTLQQQFEREDPKVTFDGLGVNETIKKCLMNDMSKRAEKVRSDFKVPDKRFWYIKLHALTAIKDFISLETFARSKKSPIGYEPFVNHLVESGYKKEASSFVARCDARKRVDLYALCEQWRKAGLECKERGDKARLEELRRTCPNSLEQRELDQILASM